MGEEIVEPKVALSSHKKEASNSDYVATGGGARVYRWGWSTLRLGCYEQEFLCWQTAWVRPE